MSPDGYLLDSSALLALIENEPGADRVEGILQQDTVWLTWLTPLEIYYVTCRERGQAEAEKRYALIKQLPAKIIWEMDEPTLLTAGHLKAEYRLSLADAIIAAHAIRANAILVHKDPEFETVSGELKLETLPYK